MPTNANTFNSRVTSEALEQKFRQVFPAQGGAELVQDLFASGVIQPVVDFSSVAEGSVLPQNLQTAMDFSTGYDFAANSTTTLINNTGFWLLNVVVESRATNTAQNASVRINDGLATKSIWRLRQAGSPNTDSLTAVAVQLVVFLRSGDSCELFSDLADIVIGATYRQIADVNGNLVNPLGFTF